MILSILCAGLGIVLGLAIAAYRKPTPDDSTSAAQQLDFLDAHMASVVFSINQERWAVIGYGRNVMSEHKDLRVAIEMARKHAEDQAAGVQLEQAA